MRRAVVCATTGSAAGEAGWSAAAGRGPKARARATSSIGRRMRSSRRSSVGGAVTDWTPQDSEWLEQAKSPSGVVLFHPGVPQNV